MTDICLQAETAPVSVTDRVRDIMVLTVPRLAIDEQMSLVEPDVLLPDDGCSRKVAKCFIYDDTPSMELREEVRGMMCLADPLMGTWTEDSEITEQYGPIPDDGLDEQWAFVERSTENGIPEVPYDVTEEACDSFAAMMSMPLEASEAAAEVRLLPMPAVKQDDTEEPTATPDAVTVTESESTSVDVPLISAPAPVAVIAPPASDADLPSTIHIPAQLSEDPEREDAPMVMFSFGPEKSSEIGWKVCFSFRSGSKRLSA